MKKSKFVFSLVIYFFFLKSIGAMRLKFKNKQEEDDYRNKLLYMLNMDSLNSNNNEIPEINITNKINETTTKTQKNNILQKRINEKELVPNLNETKKNITSKKNNANLILSSNSTEMENSTYINTTQTKIKPSENIVEIGEIFNNISLMNQNIFNENHQNIKNEDSLYKNIPKLLLPIIINKKTQIQLPKRDNVKNDVTIPTFDNYLHQIVNPNPVPIKTLPPLTVIPISNPYEKRKDFNHIPQAKIPIAELDIIESKIKKIDALSENEIAKRK